jgi:O-antigen ligase
VENKISSRLTQFIAQSGQAIESKNEFRGSLQTILNALVFFIIWPALNLVGNSITFYIFIILTLRVGSFWLKPGLGKNLFSLLALIIVVSSILAPYNEMPRHLGFQSVITIGTQWLYWILFAIFIIVHRNFVNYTELAKWVFYGTIAAAIGFYAIKFNISLGPLEIKSKLSRNAFVFTLLTAIPVSFYYLKQRFDLSKMPFFLGASLLTMLFTNGRSGGVIIFLELILITSIMYSNFQQVARGLFLFIAVLFFLNESNVLEPAKEFVANNVASINPRLASLIRSEEGTNDGDLSFDKSWLLRLLMVQKGLEIFEEHPIFGIGPNNFPSYDAKLNNFINLERLNNNNKQFFNSRSSHNSYIQVLSELGILGISIVLLILFIPLLAFVKKFFTTKLEMHDLFSISLLGAAMHFYAINTITGAIAWMFIGLAWVSFSFQKSKSSN